MANNPQPIAGFISWINGTHFSALRKETAWSWSQIRKTAE
jgi:hypothetical protein